MDISAISTELTMLGFGEGLHLDTVLYPSAYKLYALDANITRCNVITTSTVIRKGRNLSSYNIYFYRATLC